MFWPLGGITKGHEYTVGQNSTHNDHAEKSEKPVKENMDKRDNHYHQKQAVKYMYNCDCWGPVIL